MIGLKVVVPVLSAGVEVVVVVAVLGDVVVVVKEPDGDEVGEDDDGGVREVKGDGDQMEMWQKKIRRGRFWRIYMK
jgi:hypothetical protein